MARVEQTCAARGLKMTAPRRDVLDVLLADHVPMSAYEIIDRMAVRGRRPSPISVYRALDFLIGNGFAHRIESRNAFLACSHEHGPGDPAVVFLLCENCNVAEEAEPAELLGIIERIAAGTGFRPSSAVLELRGRCRRCREAEAPGEAAAAPAEAAS